MLDLANSGKSIRFDPIFNPRTQPTNPSNLSTKRLFVRSRFDSSYPPMLNY